MMRPLMAFTALFAALILHTVSASSAPRIPLANVIRCDTLPNGATHCIKYPEWRATHAEIGHWLRVTHRRRHGVPVTETFRYPILVRRVPVAAPAASWSAPMLVTWYAPTGYAMYNGQMPYQGAAACGLDLAIGARIFVPGIGSLTCGDRIPPESGNWRHIDVFNIPLGTGVRLVTVYGGGR